MISKIKKELGRSCLESACLKYFLKFKHSLTKNWRKYECKTTIEKQMTNRVTNREKCHFKILLKNDDSMHRYFFVGEEIQKRKWKKRDCCELANFVENSAIRWNYASFETWLRHRNRALNASSSDGLEISSLTPRAACREAQSFFQTVQRSAQTALRSCEWRLICIKFRV